MGFGPLTWWFSKFLPSCYTTLPRWQAVIARSVTDTWGFMPFFYFPIFYQVKEAVHWNGLAPAQEVPQIAWRKYKEGFLSDLKSTTGICLPINIILFSRVADHVRVPALAAMGFVWVLALSIRRGKQQEVEEAPAMIMREAELLAASTRASASPAVSATRDDTS
eukprot:CAMPEP_0170185368 /NCGR_PEP_ID=MMETSP0040_2-20121228/36386_1 /TAXON_ID=641309 /ORGANISM="Lotharella oceanica, Strain CCMP622" /LENGTH=163 /DNA_ID=CAMNT_0010431753 /DNA_START=165 /DNA_END=656 /DNA_ORIENTATION=+